MASTDPAPSQLETPSQPESQSQPETQRAPGTASRPTVEDGAAGEPASKPATIPKVEQAPRDIDPARRPSDESAGTPAASKPAASTGTPTERTASPPAQDTAKPAKPLTELDRKQIEAAVIVLDDAWAAAAKKRDVDAAMACFSDVGGFTFAYGGGLVRSLPEFEAIVKRAYEGRKSISSKNRKRQVTVIDRDHAVLSGTTDVELVTTANKKVAAAIVYGLVCRRSEGRWRAVHVYEFEYTPAKK